MDIRKLSPEAFKRPPNTSFVDVFGLEPVFEGLFAPPENRPSKPLLLEGPKGIAKSLSIQYFAAKRDICLVTWDCSEDVRRSQMVGAFSLEGDLTPFYLGALTTAIEVANEVGQAILCLEEINALTPQIQKILNPLTDFRRRIEVPECKRVFQINEGCRLWVTATANTATYGGVYALNEDLKSRFRVLPLGYPTEKQESSIISSVVPKAEPNLVKSILTLAKETRQNSTEYALSTRDVCQLVEDCADLGIDTALRLASGKFSGDDRATFYQRIASVFGESVAKKVRM